MEKITDLKELLKHEIMDLYSAEQQIIEALPTMIAKANNESLKNALQQHLEITKKHKIRLEEIQELMTEQNDVQSSEQSGEQNADAGTRKGFFSRIFSRGEQKCRGMEGILNEGNKMMSEDMNSDVADAAIIASAQKVEHYEISGYGTAAAYARELNLVDIANKLQQTLKEEYEADDKLTDLAVGKVNIEAEFAEGSENGNRRLNGRPKTTSKKLVAKSDSNGVSKSGRNNKLKTASRSNGKPATSKSKSSISESTNKSPALKRLSKKMSSSNGRRAMSKNTSEKRNENKLKASGKTKSLAKSSGNRSKSRIKSKLTKTKGKSSR